MTKKKDLTKTTISGIDAKTYREFRAACLLSNKRGAVTLEELMSGFTDKVKKSKGVTMTTKLKGKK